MVMKTPGVYIVEKNAFPNSVVEVATAVPAFIGYTQSAVHEGASLKNRPWRITSMAEFEHHFGGAPSPVFSIQAAAPNTAAAPPDMKAARGQAMVFQSGGQDWSLTRAAGQAGGRFLLHQSLRHFFQNGGGPCWIVSVGSFDDELLAGDETSGLVGGIQGLLKEQEPTLLVVPDAVLLSRADCAVVQAAMLQHCGHDLRKRFAILDVWGGECDRQAAQGDCIEQFREDIGINFLDHAAAYYPWLQTSVVQPGEVDIHVRDGHGELAAGSLRTAALDAARSLVNVMPPSAALAGLYALVDSTRGVWKAPANVSVNGVLKPTVELSKSDQEDLNVCTTGKSINALRSFVGEGVLVWGARTLDGNSLDWRYINVRRTMIMIEESCRLATQAFAFEPNAGPTWVTLKAMIGNFLTSLWKRGGLAGAVPEDAFSVHVGLGETMSAEDIVEGILRITVLVAISRPAEFIEITFQQQM